MSGLRIIQKGFNYSQDGPGNRLVYHLQGCNLRCPWCANPEGLSLEGCLMRGKDPESGRVREKHSCKEYSLEELYQEVMRSRMLFFEGGGVTFTGGEPTMQFAPLKELMERLRDQGIPIAMENNGTHPRLTELLPLIDYLILDFKHPDAEIHQKVTGASNERIRENLEKILNLGRQVALRIPLVHGFNDTPEALAGFLAFFKSNPMDQATLEILPYHEYGRDKWQQCGMEYLIKDGFVSEQQVAAFEGAFREAGIQVIHT
ncbi:MAG: radical SAM protein [Lachnospiraceae bacterium]|nr:radical SAM protein [Lachnospiraceae bacterium]